MDHRDVDKAVAELVKVLGPHTGEDWTVPAGQLEWSCWATAAHIAHDLLAYAGQVAVRPADSYLPFDLNVRPSASPAEVLQAVTACGRLLAVRTALRSRARQIVPRCPARRPRPGAALVHRPPGTRRLIPPNLVDVEGSPIRLIAVTRAPRSPGAARRSVGCGWRPRDRRNRRRSRWRLLRRGD